MIYFKSGDQTLAVTGLGYSKLVLVPPGSLGYKASQVQVTEIYPGDKVAKHRHIKQTEIICGLSGVCTFVFEESEIILSPEDVLIVQPGDLHGARNDEMKTCRFLTVKLSYLGEDDTEWN